MPISAIDSIKPAFEHTRRQLLQPFRFGQWSRLAFVGLLAGELSSGGSCNFQSSKFTRTSGSYGPFSAHHFPFHFGHPLLIAAVIASVVIAVMVLWVLLLYVNSVMRFVLFDSVVAKECHIGAGWKRRQRPGVRYFLWKIAIFLGSGAAFVILLGIPVTFALAAGWLQHPRQHILPLVLGGIFVFFLFLALAVGLLILEVLSKDFMVPQMALEGISAFEAWRRLWAMLKREVGGYAGYLGMKVVMAIGASIIVGIVSVIVALIILIPAGGLGAVAILVGKAAGLTWNVFSITWAIVTGSVVLFVILYLLALISVPVIVFFPAYSIYFFAARYPPLAALLYPMPPAPPETPPLPPFPLEPRPGL